MKRKIERKLRERTTTEIQVTKQRIKVLPEQGLFNYQCFDNAVEYARLHGGPVVEVITIDGNWPSLHYINQDEAGTYYETTLGYKAERLEYYLLRTIYPDDFQAIQWIFDNAVDYWSAKRLKWWHKLFGITRLV